jgi:hypothetical protein
VATKTLPEAKEKVMASINDAQRIGGRELPAGLVQMATNMLSSARNEGFKTTVDLLNRKVRDLCVRSGGEMGFQGRVEVSVLEAFRKDNEELQELLDKAAGKQSAAWSKLERIISKESTPFSSLLQCVSVR